MTMAYTLMLSGCILLYLHVFVVNCLPYEQEDIVDVKVLNVGEELKQETLPLQMGHCRYQLRGLKASMWYEVKISYPASIPASFSLQLQRDKSYIGSNMKRRLLNTEKLIFKADYNLVSVLVCLIHLIKSNLFHVLRNIYYSFLNIVKCMFF
eukprot:TRINITY_DN3969_c0_g1_i4.p1 TRINITY_DN3969_c0_g1~~TRINITY_DN3969_c0_g1_i4.p1  ORF type:complete len:152 (+),score=2.33 TRINITY_DN3969_c0_g1_i4:283-738(+)